MNLVTPRNGLGHIGKKLKSGSCTIAYCGASNGLSQNGWRTFTHAWLNETFPHKQPHREINCCLGAVGSLIGAFIAKQRLMEFKPDLVFIEYSQIDFMACAPVELVAHSVEALVRIIKSINPDCDICFLHYFSFRSDDHLHGRFTPAEEVYERVADHYGIPSISIAQYLVNLSESGKMHLTGENGAPAIYRRDRFHTTIEGNRRLAEFLRSQLLTLFAQRVRARRRRTLIDPLNAVDINDWQICEIEPDMISGKFTRIRWPKQKTGFGNRVRPVEHFSLKQGAKLSFTIHGHLAALCLVVGPDTGVIRCTIGERVEVRNLFDPFCFSPRIAMYIPLPYIDVEAAPESKDIVAEPMPSLPDDFKHLDNVPIQKPSKWTLDVVRLLVIGKLRKRKRLVTKSRR